MNAAMLIKYVRNINTQNINSGAEFGTASHSLPSEPYYHDSAYRHLHDSNTLVIDCNTRCINTIVPQLTENEFIICEPIKIDEAGKAKLQ